MHRTLYQQLIMAAAMLAVTVNTAHAGVAGCCRCTGCASPELFACRAALDSDGCETACADLGCSDTQFTEATDCVDVGACYGDCCDDLAGSCSQVPQGSCTGGRQYFANSFCDASNCLAQPPTATPSATGTVTQTATATATATSTASHTGTATATPIPTDTSTPVPTNTATPIPTDTATPIPTDTATPAPTDTATPVATDTATPVSTDTATPAPTDTPTSAPTDTPTTAPTSTPTPQNTATATDTVPPTATSTPEVPTETPSPTPTEATSSFDWLIDGIVHEPQVVGIPTSGVTFRTASLPSLSLLDAQSRFCTGSGLLPELRLDADPADCENECILGTFHDNTEDQVRIARLPRLTTGARTFDLLISTRLGCTRGELPVVLRMPEAVRYTGCTGDCDADGDTEVTEIVLGIATALGDRPLSDCFAHDRSGDGEVTIDELLAAVDSLLSGCAAP